MPIGVYTLDLQIVVNCQERSLLFADAVCGVYQKFLPGNKT